MAIRAEQNYPLRTRYYSGVLLKYGGKDALITKENKSSLYFLKGDIFARDFKYLRKNSENGYKYK